MSVLSTQTPSIGLLNGVEQDEYNFRDKGGYMEEVLDSREQLEELSENFQHGEGIFDDYQGFSDTDAQRGVVRALVSDTVLEDFRAESFPASLNSTYSVEASLPLRDGASMAWLGTVDDVMERPAETHYTHNAGEIESALRTGEVDSELPDGYTQEFLGAEASEQDRQRTQELWSDVFDDCYVVPLDRDFVDGFYDGDVLGSVVRNEDGEIVSTAAAEPARVPTAIGEVDMVELSEFATDPEYTGEGLASYNGQQVLEAVQEYGPDAVYSQNTSAQPSMTAVASGIGGELSGVLRAHANVANPSQDLVMTGFEGDTR